MQQEELDRLSIVAAALDAVSSMRANGPFALCTKRLLMNIMRSLLSHIVMRTLQTELVRQQVTSVLLLCLLIYKSSGRDYGLIYRGKDVT